MHRLHFIHGSLHNNGSLNARRKTQVESETVKMAQLVRVNVPYTGSFIIFIFFTYLLFIFQYTQSQRDCS